MTSDEFESICRDVCLACKAGHPLRVREDTGEHVHDWNAARGMAHAFCLAHYFRIKWKDELNG